MLLRLYNEDTPLQDHSKDRFNTGDRQQRVKKEPDEDVVSAAALEGDVKHEIDVDDEDEDDDDVGGVRLGDAEKDEGPEKVRNEDLEPDAIKAELKDEDADIIS